MALVRNVSDTARWVAVYRARESERRDALFHDRWAAELAGERGQAIARAARRQMGNGWAIVARTQLMDQLILSSIAEGCDCVLNLAAGFDTRPYRLSLPAKLVWVEADLPELIEEKTHRLARERPHCELQRVAVNLVDGAARRAFLERVLSSTRRVLVVTEGLVPYLEDDQVVELARALRAPSVCGWILDFTSPAIRAAMNRRLRRVLANAPFKFAPADGVAFFERQGWRVRDVRSLLRAAIELRRAPWYLYGFGLFPEPNPRRLDAAYWSGVLRLEPT
ncbi:MAG TPA: SAM-dependent methyltransferase [Polyangiaceae bacterium]|nr:SAM-dependent methyltransferase [Polyangiaceae bacterium]